MLPRGAGGRSRGVRSFSLALAILRAAGDSSMTAEQTLAWETKTCAATPADTDAKRACLASLAPAFRARIGFDLRPGPRFPERAVAYDGDPRPVGAPPLPAGQVVAWVMAPPEALLRDKPRAGQLLNRTVASAARFGYEVIVRHNAKRELSAFAAAVDFMDARRRNKTLLLLQHSTPMRAPVRAQRCDFETASWAMRPGPGGFMPWVTSFVRRALNASCGRPCCAGHIGSYRGLPAPGACHLVCHPWKLQYWHGPGDPANPLPCDVPRRAVHLETWHLFRDSTNILSPRARALVRPAVDALKAVELAPGFAVAKLHSQGLERLGGLLSAHVCARTQKCDWPCEQRILHKQHGFL